MSCLCILITTRHARGTKKKLLVVIDSFFDQDTVLGGTPPLLRSSGKKISNFELGYLLDGRCGINPLTTMNKQKNKGETLEDVERADRIGDETTFFFLLLWTTETDSLQLFSVFSAMQRYDRGLSDHRKIFLYFCICLA